MKAKNLLYGSIALGSAIFYLNTGEESNAVLQRVPLFEEKIVLSVTFVDADVIDENHIGDRWEFSSKVNGQIIRKGETRQYDLYHQPHLTIQSTATEDDPVYDDIGQEIIKITPANLALFLKTDQLLDTVYVPERHGPSAGNTANCLFTYRIHKD